MPRPLRIEYSGARYHVMGRGNRGAVIFREDRDQKIFLDTLGEVVEMTGWRIHAWVLMGTHYHLLLETPEPNLVKGMQWFPGTFTQRYNLCHGERGHLFQGRYKAKIIDDQNPSYFRRVADYIHLNPAEAGLVSQAASQLKSYAWSSYVDYLKTPSERPAWLRTKEVLSCHHIASDTAKGRRAYEALMQEKVCWMLAEQNRKSWEKEWSGYERGWVHGSNDFKQKMSEHLAEEDAGSTRNIYDREQRHFCNEAAATDALLKGLKVLSLKRSELLELKKGDSRKLLLAGWLRTHYSVKRDWVAEQLFMGHSSRVYEGVQFYRNPPPELAKAGRQLDKIRELSG